MNKILVVDDEVTIRSMVELVLMSGGYEVETAESAEAAEKTLKLASTSGAPFDLILTDVQMPGKKGDEFIRETLHLYPDLGTIAMTGYGDRNIVVSLMKSGCREFIDKPFTDDTLLDVVQRVITEQEERESRVKSLVVEQEYKNMKLANLLDDLRKQVENAAVSYEDLVSVQAIDIPLDFHIENRPLREIGGDLFLIKKRLDGKVAVLLTDVAGHDLSASFHSVLIKTLFMQYCDSTEKVSTFFSQLNSALTQGENERMITAQIILVDTERHELSYATAGHPPILHLEKSTGEVKLLSTAGGVIGLIPESCFDEGHLEYCVGDLVLFYSDGIIELTKVDGVTGTKEQLTEYGLLSLLRLSAEQETVKEKIKWIWEKALAFSHYKVLDDIILTGVQL